MKQTIILIIVVLVLGGIGYFWYAYVQSTPAEPTTTSADTQTALKQQIANLRRLKDLHLDTSIFQDPFFQQLKASDGSVLAPPEVSQQQGRPNPFLPF